MATGKAVIASRSGQLKEVIQDRKNGLLVEPGDVKGLAVTITYLLNNPVERKILGDNARKQIVNNYSWNTYSSKLLSIYKSVL